MEKTNNNRGAVMSVKMRRCAEKLISEDFDGNISKLCEELGIARSTFYRWYEKNEFKEYTNEQMVAFVDPVMYAALMTSNELQHSITVSDFEQGNANLKVKNLNGCAIIPVAADRMRTAYTFNDAGFTAGEGAGYIKAIIMPKSAASLVKKVDKVDIFTPDIVQDMDAYKINFRLYYDCFVTENKKGLIFAISGE